MSRDIASISGIVFQNIWQRAQTLVPLDETVSLAAVNRLAPAQKVLIKNCAYREPFERSEEK